MATTTTNSLNLTDDELRIINRALIIEARRESTTQEQRTAIFAIMDKTESAISEDIYAQWDK